MTERNPASSTVIPLYQRHARAWDEDRSRDLFERTWLDRFLALVPRGAAILDLGCGSGWPITGYLVERDYGVVGVDSAPAMIALCRERLPEQEWVVSDMRGLSLGRRFGGILAWDSFFHLHPDDQRRMFSVFDTHALPGAALMFTSGSSAGEAIGSYRGDALYHASLDVGEYRGLLARHGFAVVDQVIDDPDCGGHTVWLARKT